MTAAATRTYTVTIPATWAERLEFQAKTCELSVPELVSIAVEDYLDSGAPLPGEPAPPAERPAAAPARPAPPKLATRPAPAGSRAAPAPRAALPPAATERVEPPPPQPTGFAAVGTRRTQKLTPTDVVAIRAAWDAAGPGRRAAVQAALGLEYGVHPTNIYQIGKRLSWKSVPEAPGPPPAALAPEPKPIDYHARARKHSKLNDDLVRAIRRDWDAETTGAGRERVAQAWAAKVGMSPSGIKLVGWRRTWANVPDEPAPPAPPDQGPPLRHPPEYQSPGGRALPRSAEAHRDAIRKKSKLSADKVRAIRATWAARPPESSDADVLRELAGAYHVSATTIRQAIQGKTWADIE